MRHVLPITSTYVSRWGIWECLREFLQNAKDEEDEHGHKMTIEHKDGWLHIENEGADLTVDALLIGQTSKAGKRELRGTHGEGLDLALLAGVRADYDIEILTKSEKWVPKLEQVREFNFARCLTVGTRALKVARTGVRVSVRVDRATWAELMRRFLFLTPPAESVVTDAGTLLVDQDRRGEIFVKGIYVMKAHKSFGYGFDLKDVALDRDRQMIGAFDLQWALARVIEGALGRDPKRYVTSIMGLLSEGSDEVEYLGSQLQKGSEGSKALAEAFKAEHGEKAIPVASMLESQMLDRLGAKGVVVSHAAVKVLSLELGDYSTAASKLRVSAVRRYGWHELTEGEQENLTRASKAIASITATHMKDVNAQLQVVDFADNTIEGLCHLGSGEIQVSKPKCSNYYDLMEVLVHEVAHAVTQAGDGARSHVWFIERMWRTLYEDACGR